MNRYRTAMWLFIPGKVAHPHNAKRPSHHGAGNLMRICMLAIGFGLLTGCSTLFFADFENDTAFQPPDLTPPGPPAGDEIVLDGGPGAVFEVTPNALDGERSFRIAAAPNNMARVRMRADGTGNPERPIVVSFTGRLIAGSHGEINIATGGPYFAVQITLQGGSITANDLPVGTYVEGGQHNMVLTMFPATDTFNLVFTGQVLVGDGITGPLNDPNGYPGDDYAMAVEVLPTPDGGTYIVDNPRISSRNF